ncbi:protein kinase, putative [Leishmania tarentolae]|uniref:non-specific serine/threonine protein kinase n=1 Tax=Leishmania tarentolae TaxID=5689 RepID=A0A640KRK4_LEITA|nr:protein kinase, putative [Leishmania tarentolae]
MGTGVAASCEDRGGCVMHTFNHMVARACFFFLLGKLEWEANRRHAAFASSPPAAGYPSSTGHWGFSCTLLYSSFKPFSLISPFLCTHACAPVRGALHPPRALPAKACSHRIALTHTLYTPAHYAHPSIRTREGGGRGTDTSFRERKHSMGNQLAATAAVDLANVSGDLELVTPLGAEGRNYFATFHCLDYAPLTAAASNEDHARGRSRGSTASHPHSTTTPQCFYGFISAEVDGNPGGSGALGQRHEYRPSNCSRVPSATLLGGVPADSTSQRVVSSPWVAGRDRGRGRGTGGTGGGIDLLYSLSDSAANTTQLLARERAAWHQARWRQRSPMTDRPWCTVPSSLRPEVRIGRGGAALDRWCRDTRSSAMPAAGGTRYNFRVSSADNSLPYANNPASGSPGQEMKLHTATAASYAAGVSVIAGQTPNINALVAGMSGEWRSNYGNYVQLLLRRGVSSGITSSSAVAARSGLRPTVTSESTSTGFLSSSTSLRQRYLVEDVVTKVFVRTPDDPGQAYFLKYVHEMMDKADEKLRIVDSTLKRTTPRNCLWYSLVCEGDGFCVLQRPYVAFTLRERLVARPVWTAQEKLFIVYQLLEAVAHLHETYGLTHGDIKPNNVLVQSTGVLLLCDFALFKPCLMPLDSPLLFDYYYDTDENRACYVAPEKFSDQPLPTPPLASKTRGSATYNVSNVNFDGHTSSMDVFSTACVVLFLYKEEDPLRLSQMLSLRHLANTEAREAFVAPILRDANVPAALHPLLLPMLCATAEERPSARELVSRGLQQRIFPASFPYLYESVLPHLLTTAPDTRLLLFHNQLEAVLQRCEVLDMTPEGSSSTPSMAKVEVAASTEAGGANAADLAAAVSPSRQLAVSLLLPLLLQTLHSSCTGDEAAYRGFLCLRRCASYCSFTCLVDAVLPHALFYVNNDAHVYGPSTRLMALRLLSFISEVIAYQLTLKSPQRWCGTTTTLCDTVAAQPNDTGEDYAVPEEQWALMEHLVLPCLYGVLRQAEQESTVVLVEVASRLPRLLLLTRYITERRQLLYGTDAMITKSTTFESQCSTQGHRPRQPGNAAYEQQSCHDPLHVQPHRQPTQHPFPDKGGDEDDRAKTVAPAATTSPTLMSPPRPPPPIRSSDALCASPTEGAILSEQSVKGCTQERSAPEVRHTESRKSANEISDGDLENVGDVHGASAAGTQQYLAQLHCLLTNGWSMLQILYNHPCVAVVVEVMQHSASTVAAFLGEERVTENLIPLLTTALSAPLRVQRVLYSQAILLHALLQRPPTKTLRLFVDEGLRHKDDVCLSRTLHSIAAVVRSRRLPLEETMSLVHQALPILVDSRLWLREAACGVVEAAAQTYSASDIALHLEYAVRPLLMLPVPLAHLRRYAATAIRDELAMPFMSLGGMSGPTLCRYASSVLSMERGSAAGSACLLDDDIFEDGESMNQSLDNSTEGGDGQRGHSGQCRGFEDVGGNGGTFKDVLPEVVAMTHSYTSGPAPVLLHGITLTEASLPSAARSRTCCEARLTEAASTTQHSCSAANTCIAVDGGSDSDDRTLIYRPTAREVARVQLESHCASPHLPSFFAPLSPPPSGLTSSHVVAPCTSESSGAATTVALSVHDCQLPTPPHSMDVSPLPTTLPPPSGVSRCSLKGGATRVLSGRVTPSFLISPAAAAGTAVTSCSCAPSSALNPTAAALSSVSAHMGAIYATAPSPSANGIVISAGARGEAFVWQVAATHTSTARARELCLVERVAAAASDARVHTYTACQWISAPGNGRDFAPTSSSAAASGSLVAFASTDGVVGVLDVEKNAWVSSTVVSGTLEGGLTGLALQDRASLLVTTAAGGLHVVDTRCRGRACAEDEEPSVGSTASVWHTRLNPLDGAPSCVCPLYMGDKACAAAVGTYGGAVCLYDLRYQLCAQRVVLVDDKAELPLTSPLASMRPSITTVCVDPLSALCHSCRPSSWEPEQAVGPSMLLGTNAGTVYRLLLQNASYWPAFRCCRNGSGAIRTMLTQPTHGSVFTGSEDGYIRSWSTDCPETSHTLVCAPYRSRAYTLLRTGAAKRALAENAARVDAASPPGNNSSKGLASLTVCEGNDTHNSSHALPRHAPDAILTLCAVRTSTTSSAYWSCGVSGGGGGGESCYLLSGSRDGTLTLWDNEPGRL